MVETSFNVGLNNIQKDVKNVVKYWFANIFKKRHNSKKHAKFIVIDQLRNTSKPKKTLTQQRKRKYLDSKIRCAMSERFQPETL